MLRFALPLLLGLSFCDRDETVSGYAGTDQGWILAEIDGTAFPARATLHFPEEGRIAGEAPCNSYSGTQAVPYPWFEASAIAATKRACPALDAEAAYFEALGEMTLAEVSGRLLILSNDEGRMMVFRRADQSAN
ncbi:META domain-containing protein [Maritimibacter sp. 55A14]|nr:META domain-containing protein [Maritimibacter sp. 55A14]PWE32535.1 META domain-containing protein [Maritimibacter sp. 55A14]